MSLSPASASAENAAAVNAGTANAAAVNAGDVPKRARGKVATWIRGAAIRLGVVLFVLAFLFLYVTPDVLITVQSGEVGVLYRRLGGGTQIDSVTGEGLTFVAPWDRLFIYNVRVQEHKHKMHVLTNDGLQITLHLSVRYHPERDMVALLHQRVGPEYRERIVIPEVESVLRTTMGHFGMNEVYGADRGVLQRIISDSLDEVSQKYVQIDDVIVREVELPPQVSSIIEEKMMHKERAASYEYRLASERKEAERKEIEANGFRRYNELLSGSITPEVLRWRGLEVTRELAQSPNAKTLFLGNKSGDLPILLDGIGGGSGASTPNRAGGAAATTATAPARERTTTSATNSANSANAASGGRP
jgi:regulator of protease activity HflC (stomatin/prohibitin superfamily)